MKNDLSGPLISDDVVRGCHLAPAFGHPAPKRGGEWLRLSCSLLICAADDCKCVRIVFKEA